MGCFPRSRDSSVNDNRRNIIPRLEGTPKLCRRRHRQTDGGKQEEAFEIWSEWSLLYPRASDARKLIEGISENWWLVSLIHHDYKDEDGLWRFLLDGEKDVRA